MLTTLPYVPTPGSIKTALEKIRAAATPERVTGDFVSTKLQMKGGTGAAIPPFLKKIGFVASDGTPTDIYKRFRNQATAGAALAEAIRIGYKPLLAVNEYFYDLNDKDLLSLILQVTGADAKSQVAKLTLSAINNLKAFADFEAKVVRATDALSARTAGPESEPPGNRPAAERRTGLNLSYTINLNLPATSDQAVFNAIFKSLKEHLLNTDD